MAHYLGHLVRHWIKQVLRHLRVSCLCVRPANSHKRSARSDAIRTHRIEFGASDGAKSLCAVGSPLRLQLAAVFS